MEGRDWDHCWGQVSRSIEGQVQAQYESETLLRSTTLVNIEIGLPALVKPVAGLRALELLINNMDFLVPKSGILVREKCTGFMLVGNV